MISVSKPVLTDSILLEISSFLSKCCFEKNHKDFELICSLSNMMDMISSDALEVIKQSLDLSESVVTSFHMNLRFCRRLAQKLQEEQYSYALDGRGILFSGDSKKVATLLRRPLSKYERLIGCIFAGSKEDLDNFSLSFNWNCLLCGISLEVGKRIKIGCNKHEDGSLTILKASMKIQGDKLLNFDPKSSNSKVESRHMSFEESLDRYKKFKLKFEYNFEKMETFDECLHSIFFQRRLDLLTAIWSLGGWSKIDFQIALCNVQCLSDLQEWREQIIQDQRAYSHEIVVCVHILYKDLEKIQNIPKECLTSYNENEQYFFSKCLLIVNDDSYSSDILRLLFRDDARRQKKFQNIFLSECLKFEKFNTIEFLFEALKPSFVSHSNFQRFMRLPSSADLLLNRLKDENLIQFLSYNPIFLTSLLIHDQNFDIIKRIVEFSPKVRRHIFFYFVNQIEPLSGENDLSSQQVLKEIALSVWKKHYTCLRVETLQFLHQYAALTYKDEHDDRIQLFTEVTVKDWHLENISTNHSSEFQVKFAERFIKRCTHKSGNKNEKNSRDDFYASVHYLIPLRSLLEFGWLKYAVVDLRSFFLCRTSVDLPAVNMLVDGAKRGDVIVKLHSNTFLHILHEKVKIETISFLFEYAFTTLFDTAESKKWVQIPSAEKVVSKALDCLKNDDSVKFLKLWEQHTNLRFDSLRKISAHHMQIIRTNETLKNYISFQNNEQK
eukprot:GDKJ01020244.1.p1 GENE.GDKJ01020244.1~~GDKJ01020244.1.p1  ORF type:complete len:722 (+),score=106.41 GDKJ01020244.1:35-2200(+)